jgi:hypothetical protein
MLFAWLRRYRNRTPAPTPVVAPPSDPSVVSAVSPEFWRHGCELPIDDLGTPCGAPVSRFVEIPDVTGPYMYSACLMHYRQWYRQRPLRRKVRRVRPDKG